MKNITKIPLLLIILIATFSLVSLPDVTYAISQKSLYKKIQKLDNEKVKKMPIPVVLGVGVNNLQDTWGDARSGGRTHEGIDIFASRNALIASPTKAVVTKIANKGLGGIQVWTANPGNERFYYAHLESVYPSLNVGDTLNPGDIIGFMGNSGNAYLGSPHLHLGIYTQDGAINPYKRFTKEFSLEQRINTLQQYLSYLQKELRKKNK